MTVEEKRADGARRSREYRAAHPERVKKTARKAYLKWRTTADPAVLRRYHRQYHLRSNYDISLEQYEEMLSAQNGVCAICKQPESSLRRGTFKSLDVDHNHATGAVRGLLCSACNASLGLLREDPIRIQALLDYIEHHNAE